MTLQGTDKQIKFAKNLIDELLSSPKRMISKMETRGLEKLNERQLNRYNEYKALVDGIESIEVANAGTVIVQIKNYNGGAVSNEILIERLSK